VDGKYSVIPERGKVVELIYQLCADGMGVNLITKELTQRQIPAFTGKKWTQPYVAKILFGEAAIGHHTPLRRDPATKKRIPTEKIENLYPAVISETLNAQAKVAMRQRKNKGGRVNLNGKIHPFSGLLRTHTGAALHVKYRAVGRKDPKLVPYLQDQSNGNSYPLSYFEFYLLSWLVKFEPEPTKKQSNSEITALEGKIAKLDHKIQTLKDRINAGEEYESFLDLLATAEKQRKDQSQKLAQLRAITPVGQGLVTMQGLCERLSPEDSNDHADHTKRKTNLDPADYTNREINLELRATLRRMVKQIEVTIGQEHRFWPKKSLRVSITFRDGNRAEFMHKF
jgi:hypothetical protein